MPTITAHRWPAWLVVVLAVGAVLGIVTLVGGFAPDDRDRAVPTAQGTAVETRNWQLTVHDAVLTDTTLTGSSLTEPVVRVRVDVVNVSTETRSTPRRGLVTMTMADHDVDDLTWLASAERSVGFDPHVPRPTWAEATAVGEPTTVTVTIRTERETWSYADGIAAEALGDPVARIEVPVRDERSQR